MANKLTLIVKEDNGVISEVHYRCGGTPNSICIMNPTHAETNWHGRALVHFFFTAWIDRQLGRGTPSLYDDDENDHDNVSKLYEWLKKVSQPPGQHAPLRVCLKKAGKPEFHLRLVAEIALEVRQGAEVKQIKEVGYAKELLDRVIKQLPPKSGWLPNYRQGPAAATTAQPSIEILDSTKEFYRALDIAVQHARFEVWLTNFSLTGLHWENAHEMPPGRSTLPKSSELSTVSDSNSVENYGRSIAKVIDSRARDDGRGLDVKRMVTMLSRSKFEHVWNECCKYQDRTRFECRVLDVSPLYHAADLQFFAPLAHNYLGNVPTSRVPYPMNLQLIDQEIVFITRPALGYQTPKDEGASVLIRGVELVRPFKDFYKLLWGRLRPLKDGDQVHIDTFADFANRLAVGKSAEQLKMELDARGGAASE